MECGRGFGQITGKHLKTHGINTVAEYLAKHPGAQTVEGRKDSTETIERKRIARTGKKHSEASKARIGAGNRGKKMSAEAIDKWRESYARYLEEHGSPMLGKDRGEAFRKKMSEIAKARPKESVDAKVAQMLAARRGSKAAPEQRDRYREARLKYIADHPDKTPKRMFNTKPEQQFVAILDSCNLPYERNFRLGNRLFDFKICDDVLIEIDGPYHRTLGFYINPSASDEEKVEKLRRFIERDRVKDKIARDNGFFIYRIPVGQGMPANWIEILQSYGCDLF
jgi:very-short-patch-repair endonuclease